MVARQYLICLGSSLISSFDSENWSSGEDNRKRGRDWLDQIYKANHKSTENTLAAHQDFCNGNPFLNNKQTTTYRKNTY